MKIKWLIILTVSVLFFSCEKKEEKISILTAKVEGKNISFVGNAHRYKDIRNDVPFGYAYYIFNLGTPILYIEAYDSSFTEHEFEFPNIEAKYVFSDTNSVARNYIAINGNFRITKEEKGILFGDFNFILVNMFDNTDSIHIEDGYFEITLEEYDRVWYN